MMICNVLKDFNVKYTISGVTVRKCLLRLFMFDLSGQNGPYPFFFFSLELVFLPSNSYVYMLTEPPTLF